MTPPPDGTATWRRLLPLVLVGSLVPHLVYVEWAAVQNLHTDLFIYRSGAVVGLRGESPYPPDRIGPLVAAQFPEFPELATNCAFLMPPEAILLLAPLALMPWPAAKVVWVAAGALVGAAGAVALTAAFGRRPGRLPLGSLAVVPVVLLNFMALASQVPGQTSLLAFGCVAIGQWCFERGRAWAGTVLWAVPFLKPHVAIPLLPLAWYLGGWRRAAGVAAAVAGLNAAGGLISTGSPFLIADYLREVSTRRQGVTFNRAELNPQIVSWNRAVIAAGGPVIELSVAGVLAGYAVWGMAAAARAWRAGVRPSPGWAAAAAAIGAVLCAQTLGYELLILGLLAPHLLDLWEARRRGWVVALVAALLVQLVPYPQFSAWVESRGVGPRWEDVLLSYRSFGLLALAAVFLAGPVLPAAAPAAGKASPPPGA